MEMAERWTLGKVPDHEEPDTYLIGEGHCFFARVVGRPGHPAEPKARLMCSAPDLARENARLREVNAALVGACEEFVYRFPDLGELVGGGSQGESAAEMVAIIRAALARAAAPAP
jgi:hypothetical protein